MLSDPQVWASLFTLTILEVVLSIDNLVVIAVLVGKLPKALQAKARYIGMTLALVPRLVLLIFIGWIIGLTEPLFDLFGHGVSGKDLILAAGGLFLIYKATHEIHNALEGEEGEASARVMANYAAVVAQIAIINLVFSIDSIVTAVGMANEIWVMAVAVILSMVVLMAASGPVASRGASHGEDPGPGLPDHDRHGPGGRRLRRTRAQGLHLHRHGVLGVHRADQHAASSQGERSSAQPLRRGDRAPQVTSGRRFRMQGCQEPAQQDRRAEPPASKCTTSASGKNWCSHPDRLPSLSRRWSLALSGCRKRNSRVCGRRAMTCS